VRAMHKIVLAGASAVAIVAAVGSVTAATGNPAPTPATTMTGFWYCSGPHAMRMVWSFNACATGERKFFLTPPSGAGLTGPTGPAGPRGVAGPTGATGVAGVTGAAGAPGAAGSPGAAGAAGSAGATGPAGATGATGAVGPTGATGATGAVGATGPSDAFSVQGVASHTNVTGGAMVDIPGTAVTLPAGSYVVSWNVDATASVADPTASELRCTVRDGGIEVLDRHRAGLDRVGLSNVSGQGSVTLASTTTLRLSCRAFPSSDLWITESPELTAVRVGTLTP